MSKSLFPAILFTLVVAITATSCDNSGSDEEDSDGVETAAPTEYVDESELTDRDIELAAIQSDLHDDGWLPTERSRDGVKIFMIGPARIEVGATKLFVVQVINDSRNSHPESPFAVIQNSGQFLTSGPIEITETDDPNMEGPLSLQVGKLAGGHFDVTCTAVGNATITFQSRGATDATSPPSTYSLTIDVQIECVTDAGTDLISADITALVNRAIGFQLTTLNWVQFEQNNIKLLINQIEPVELDIGESVEIYSYFDAISTLTDPNSLGLIDAKLELSGGGPISIDSPPGRQSEFLSIFSDPPRILWGFRSGTLTCLDEGEGVYSVTLTGKLYQSGETTTQIVSGEVDCKESPPTAVPDAKRDATADVYNLGGEGNEDIAYDQAQFRIEQPHDGCSSTHVHADFTVLAFREWASGGLSGPRMNGDLPRVDPDPSGCGFGSPDSLSHRRVRVPGQIFLDFCTRVEQAGTSKPMVTRCEQQRIFLTSE